MTTIRAAWRAFSGSDERLANLDATFGPHVERVLGKLGIRHAEAAQHIGVSRQTFEKTLEPGKVMRATWLFLLPIAARIELVREVLGETHDVVELPARTRAPSDLALVADAQRETGEAVACALRALGAGHLGRAEGAALERECDEAIAVLLTVRELARTAQREGVVGLRREA